VTEIPEHLLKRSRERRAALGLGGEAEAASTPATTSATTPAVAAAAPRRPPATGPAPGGGAGSGRCSTPQARPGAPPSCRKRRRRIPFWAMAALSLMPVWAFMYARSLTETAEAAEGRSDWAPRSTASARRATAATAAAASVTPSPAERCCGPSPTSRTRSATSTSARASTTSPAWTIYGNPDREGGPHITGALGIMPQFRVDGRRCAHRLRDPRRRVPRAVHARRSRPDEREWSEEYERWCSEESPIFEGLEGGQFGLSNMETVIDDIIPIGDAPVPGSPAGAG
jgi:hypothetical protein